MLKIVYAAAPNENARIQLFRFINEVKNKPYIIKIAAYRVSSPKELNIDWTLDALHSISKPNFISLDNENFSIYYDQIKSFGPDLIISDLEYFTSCIANYLNIPLWQYSSSLVKFALSKEQKHNSGIFKNYFHLFNNDHLIIPRIINMIDNSDRNLVCSYFADMESIICLPENFEWVRPYHKVGVPYNFCKHNIVAASFKKNKKILDILRRYTDSVMFTDFYNENHNIILKNINYYDEYISNIYNCNLFICEGSTNFMADAYYNNKYTVVVPNSFDTECVINSVFSEHLKFSKTIHEHEDLNKFMDFKVVSRYLENTKYLHEKIDYILQS
jgi:uncharacterized protein (TIGR00661 family)